MKLDNCTTGSLGEERAQRQSFEAMKLRLQQTFATPDSECDKLSAGDIRRRAVADARR